MARHQEWNPSRTETAIRSVTHDDDLPTKIAGHRIVIQIGEPGNENSQHALLATVNLLTRLDTILEEIDVVIDHNADRHVFHPGATADSLEESVRTISRAIGSPVQVNVVKEPDGQYDAAVILGDTQAVRAPLTVHVGSDGWLAHIDTTEKANTSFSENTNPIGSYLASCMAAAEVYKHVLRNEAVDPLKVRVEHVDDIVFSAFDYSVNTENPPNPELPDPVDLDSLHVFGVGAGGGALIHALSAVDEVVGNIQLVDSDEVSSSNLNRYIWAFAEDVDAMKTDIGKGLLSRAHPGLMVNSHPVPYGEYADSTNCDTFELAVSTVDSVAAREQIQWDFPRTVLDAAVDQQGFYVVSRIEFGNTQCLGCKHSHKEDGKERELEAVAERIGLPAETVQQMDTDNGAFTQEQVESIEAYAGDDREFTIPEVGERFSDWFGEQCGHMDLSISADPVPAPFLPVTAGVLLAGEVIKDGYYPEFVVSNKFTHNMFFLPRERLHKLTKPAEECSICQSQTVIEHYQSRWG